MIEERELVQRILAGNTNAFGQLVRQYEKLVFYVIRRLVTEQQDVEDICQEVFIKVYKNLSSFAFEAKLSTWIARIAYLTAVNYLKKAGRHPTTAMPETADFIAEGQDDPAQLLVQQDVSAYVNRLIEQLPLPYRTVLTLYHLNEFSCEEIEQITGMPEGTVKSYLYRARRQLKDKLMTYLKNER
jgi:RNA polymerase sigma-70 factor (ECF subfamily)